MLSKLARFGRYVQPLASRLDARIESLSRSSNGAGARNAPGLVRDGGGRSQASAGPSKPKQITGSAIDTLRLFLVSRYSAEHRMLNLEHMADDPVLKEHGIAPPGTKNAPTNMAGALWKLAAEMFPDVSHNQPLSVEHALDMTRIRNAPLTSVSWYHATR